MEWRKIRERRQRMEIDGRGENGEEKDQGEETDNREE